MKILDKYILKFYLSRFLSVFAICFLIFIIQTFWLYIDELAGKGIDIFTIGKFFIYFSPKLVPLVLPLSILLASLTTYGTLSENYEFVAMKSNGISITMPYWDQRFYENKKDFPEIKTDQFHIDILAARFVLTPEWFDVVVASNLFGDILSDLGPACTGTIGIAPSGNINPTNKHPSLFEPVHGSAPDIAGKGIANPIGQIWSGAMMLDYLGEKEAATRIVSSIEKTLLEKQNRTKDLDGDSNTKECANKILDNIN